MDRQIAELKPLVHWHHPPSCRALVAPGEKWSGDLDRVTCQACRDEPF